MALRSEGWLLAKEADRIEGEFSICGTMGYLFVLLVYICRGVHGMVCYGMVRYFKFWYGNFGFWYLKE